MKKFKKTERVKNDTNINSTPEKSLTSETDSVVTASPNSTDTNNINSTNSVNVENLINSAKTELANQPTKRKRATKAEMLARNGNASQAQPMIDVNALQIQDYSELMKPYLQTIDILASDAIADKYKVSSKALVADESTLTEASKALNKPVNIILARYGGNVDPVMGAAVSIIGIIGALTISKLLIIRELKKDAQANQA